MSSHSLPTTMTLCGGSLKQLESGVYGKIGILKKLTSMYLHDSWSVVYFDELNHMKV